MRDPKCLVEIVRSSVHAADIWHAYAGGALFGVLGRTAVDHGQGEEWRVLWRRGDGGRSWEPGGDGRWSDKERAADAAFLGFAIGGRS